MASTPVVKVMVQELTKYGFKANDRFVNYSKQLSEGDKAKVVPGASFEAEYYVADSGKEYLNKVLTQTLSGPSMNVIIPSPVVDDEARAKRFTPKFQKKEANASDAMSKAEWAAKDQRISRQGVIQAAVIALAPVVSLDLLPTEAVKLAIRMLEFVNPS
jgi:hypothetical protein